MWRRFAEGVLKVYLIIGGVSIFISAGALASATESFMIFLITAVTGALILLLGGMMLGLFTEAVRYLEDIAKNTSGTSIAEKTSPQISYSPEKGKLNLSEVANKDGNIDGEWRCRNCDAKNAANAIFCKSCGNHK